MNAVKPPVSSCSVAQPQQVLDPLFVGLHRAVHHRRRRAQAGAVRLAHDVEPFVGGRLAVAVEQLAHAVDENLGAAAGNAVEPGGDQAIDHRGHRQLRQPRDVNHLRRRQRVQLELRIALLDRAEQILVPRQRQIGIVAALQQQLDAADGDRLVDLPEQLVEAEHVALRRSDRPIERAEVAPRDADVRVVDVAVDDVGDDAVGMLARADAVGEPAEQRRRRVAIQLRAPRRRVTRAAGTLSAICQLIASDRSPASDKTAASPSSARAPASAA